MEERRYTESEVAEIFERAARDQAAAGPFGTGPRDGRTLDELRSIGEEVGIPGALIVRAARSLDAERGATGGRFLGFPIAVGRTVELGRELSDAEWERLVVDLRETFDARGRIRSAGSLREWTNGNLQALVEPGEDGDRLRLRTTKGDSRQMMGAGLFLLGLSVVILLAGVLTGGLGGDWDAIAILGLLGLGVFGAGALRLPSWSATRREQMEGIATRLLAAPSPGDDDPVADDTPTGP